jgi:hypothetical protein
MHAQTAPLEEGGAADGGDDMTMVNGCARIPGSDLKAGATVL